MLREMFREEAKRIVESHEMYEGREEKKQEVEVEEVKELIFKS